MIEFEEFTEIGSIQASLFITNFNFSTSKILQTVLDHFSGQFDGEPTVLPLPDNAPMEIPRIILEKKDKSMRLELSPNRLTLYRIKFQGEDKISQKKLLSTNVNLLIKLVKDIKADCVRMGVIIERFCPKREPAKDIAIHFCKENFIKKPFNQPNAFEINSLKKYIFLDSFDVNSWVKIKSGGVKLKPKEVLSPVVIAHQDINTFTELMDIKTYNDNDIVKFFSNISDEFDSILKLYFPKS